MFSHKQNWVQPYPKVEEMAHSRTKYVRILVFFEFHKLIYFLILLTIGLIHIHSML